MAAVQVRGGIYARISSDREGDGLGVNRQLADCERLAELRGWQVADSYVDDDVSAYGGKPRPEYRRLIADIEAGVVDAVVVYNLDRLHRQPKELEEFIEVCRHAGIEGNLASCQGHVDLATHHGVLTARMLGAVAAMESDDKSRRIRRKHEELALSGKVSGGGSRPYGYDGDRKTIRPAEAAIVRECARRFLAGESIRSICADLNARAIATVSGGEWSPQTLRRLLGSARIAGQREHKGEIVAKAEWRGIISKPDSARIRGRLADPERRTNKSARRYLLVRLLRCALCGESLIARPRSGGQRRYACAKGPGMSGCGHLYITADEVEAWVLDAVFFRLDSPELAAAINGRQDEPDADRWQQEADQAQAQLEELAAAYGERAITMGEWRAAREPIEQRRSAARKKLARATRTTVLAGYPGNAAALREQWASLDLTRQHAIVSAVLDHVVVSPGRRGYNRFDEARLRPLWRL